MKIKLYILLCICLVLVLLVTKPWSISITPGQKQPVKTGRHKAGEPLKQRTPGKRVAAYLAAVRGKRGILLDSKLYMLGDLKNPGIVEPLLRALDDKDPMVRVFAAYALGRIRDPRALEPLLKVLERRKKKDYAAAYAAEALGNFNDPRIVSPLIAALEDPYYEVRGFAASSLGKMKAKEANFLLTQKLDDPHWFVRQQAAFGLEAMKAANRVESLALALKNEKDPNTLANLVILLGKTGDPAAVQPLLEALRTLPNSLARINAANALSEIKDSAAIAPMAQALKQEKDPHVKSWIFSELKRLKEDQQYGKLRFLEGKPVPEIRFRPVAQRDKKVLSLPLPAAASKGNIYQISTAYNLRQHIDKNGFVHLVVPFSSPVAVEDTGDFVFALHERHCEVFCKAEQSWQVFSYSNGFPPHDFELNVENYKNHVIFRDKDLAELPVLHFDKTKRVFSMLSVEELELRQKPWERMKVEDSKREWLLNGSAIMKRDPANGGETALTMPVNNVKDMVSFNGRLLVSSGASIRVFEKGKEIKFLNAQNLLYSNKITALRVDGSNLLVLYKGNIDIFDTTGDIKLLHRFAFPELNKDDYYTTPPIDFNSYGLFYAEGRRFIAEEPGSREKIYEAWFNDFISGILHYQSQVLIQTGIGFSVFHPDTREIKHFYENRLQKNPPEEDEYEYYFLEPIGINDNYYVFIERIGIEPPPKLAFFNFKTQKIESCTAYPHMPLLTTSFKQLRGVLMDKEFLLTMDFGEYPMDSHLRSFSIYRPAESGKPLLIATISQDTAMPVGEPRGYSIKAFRAEENNLWLATDFGLFSFDLGKKQWQNRFTGRNLSYLKDIAVTEE